MRFMVISPTIAVAAVFISLVPQSVGAASGGDQGGAAAPAQDVAVSARQFETLSSDDSHQFDAFVSAFRSGESLAKQGDIVSARKAYEKGLSIIRPLTVEHPNNLRLQRDLRAILVRMGAILRQQDELSKAITEYTESLTILQRLLVVEPNDATLQLDKVINLYSLAEIPGSAVHWNEVQAAAEDLDRKGILSANYRRLLDDSQILAAQPPMPVIAATNRVAALRGVTLPREGSPPDRNLLMSQYPQKAVAERVAGQVNLRCRVLRTGILTQCEIVAESPKDYGFGAAAERIAAALHIEPETIDGQPTDYGVIDIPIRFGPF